MDFPGKSTGVGCHRLWRAVFKNTWPLAQFLTLYRMHHENAGLEEAQAEIKIAGGNTNNLRYADDTTLMAESEELKSLLMEVRV